MANMEQDRHRRTPTCVPIEPSTFAAYGRVRRAETAVPYSGYRQLAAKDEAAGSSSARPTTFA
jgi:hypothetical protein